MKKLSLNKQTLCLLSDVSAVKGGVTMVNCTEHTEAYACKYTRLYINGACNGSNFDCTFPSADWHECVENPPEN